MIFSSRSNWAEFGPDESVADSDFVCGIDSMRPLLPLVAIVNDVDSHSSERNVAAVVEVAVA